MYQILIKGLLNLETAIYLVQTKPLDLSFCNKLLIAHYTVEYAAMAKVHYSEVRYQLGYITRIDT